MKAICVDDEPLAVEYTVERFPARNTKTGRTRCTLTGKSENGDVKGRTQMKKTISMVLALMLLASVGLTAFASGKQEAQSACAEYTSFSDLSGKTVSMLTGAPFEALVRSKAPDVGEFTFFNNTADILLALKSGKTDALLTNNAIAELAVNRDPALALFPERLQDGVFGIAFAKGDPRRDQWQAAFDSIPGETIQAAWAKWTGSDETAKVLPEQDWPGTNGTVTVAACDTLEPMSYLGEAGEIRGFDNEIILLVAKALDVHVEFTGMEFAAILSSVQAGKADLGCGSIIVTDERREAVDFVEYFPAAFVLVVRSAPNTGNQAEITSKGQLKEAGRRIGVGLGSAAVSMVEQEMPNATLVYLELGEGCEAVAQGKLDAYVYDRSQLELAVQSDRTGVRLLDENMNDAVPVAVGISPVSAVEDLEGQMNAFITQLKTDGTLEDMLQRWVRDGDMTMPDIQQPDNPVLHLTVGTSGIVPPFSYYEGTELSGFDIELARRFAGWMNADLSFKVYDYGAIVAAAVSGDVDCIMANLNVTSERAETLPFSDILYELPVGILVREETMSASASGFWSGLQSSFEKTFLREQRWKLFLEGIVTTLVITVCSVALGTALGFGAYMACRRGNVIANQLTRWCMWLVQGMPMVVLLMVLYYIIFGSISVSGIFVAVLGFTLTFGAAVFGLLKLGVGAVDPGQYEAARSLGYSDAQTFFQIILPQALPHVLDSCKGEIVALIKATAIVGYIAVQDLTKMGDIVRSRTYEAFFPLIAVTVFYFLLEGLLGLAFQRVTRNMNPRRRSRQDILRGGENR